MWYRGDPMTKRVNVLPSERIDVPDYVASTTGFTAGTAQQLLNDLIISHFPRIVSGLRVEIANQGTSPGEITVWNGIAIDRSGQLFQNEDEANTQRSITLNADGTYYVEVMFTTTPSDSDARAFWNPTFDNGTDPSGDPRMPGREMFQTVSTRLSPDWQIVNPVSTSGFDITTNPNSVKVPVAVITITGGVVVGGSTVPARTCVSQVANIGDSKLYVFDTRLMPDSFAATVDAEVISVTANDRDNGILTLSGTLAAQHLSGARVVRTGSGLNQFLVNRSTPALPSSGTADGRPMLWRASEDRGYGLAQDADGAGRSDAQIQQLQDELDFLAAQIREMRFGAERTTDMGMLAPPTSYAAAPRYFERAGGIQGARAVTVSIGDGTTTWGDFNVAQYGSFDAAMTAALAAVPLSGGEIFIKPANSPYSTTTGVAISNRAITITGDTRTGITAAGGAGALILNNATLNLRDITIARSSGGTSVSAIVLTGTASIINADNCSIQGISGTVALSGSFHNCQVNEQNGGTTNHIALTAPLSNCVFRNTTFATFGTVSGSRAVVLGASSTQVGFYGCTFKSIGSSAAAIVEAVSGAAGSLVFRDCTFAGTATTTVQDAILIGSASAFVDTIVDNCASSGLGTGGLVNAVSGSGVVVNSCFISVAANGYGVKFQTGCTNVSILGCTFNQGAGGATATYGILGTGTCSDFFIDRCTFVSCAFGIDVDTMTGLHVRDCHSYQAGGCGRAFLWSVTAISQLTVRGCEVQGLQDAGSGVVAGIRLTANSTNVNISECTFHDLGLSTTGVHVSGILVAETGITIGKNFSISGCNFKQINGASVAAGVFFEVNSDNYQDISISSCQFYQVGVSNQPSGVAYAVYVDSVANFTMTGNTADVIGNTGSSVAGYGLYVNEVVLRSSITSNAIDGVGVNNASSSGAAIFISGTIAQYVTVSNNALPCEGGCFFGIAINSSNAASQVSDLTVTGNVIGFDGTSIFDSGIVVRATGNTTLVQSRFIICNNTVRGFNFYGIRMTSTSGSSALASNVTLNNNVLESDVSGATGMSLTNLANLSVCGNSVNLSDATSDSKRALSITTSEELTIFGNTFRAVASNVAGFVLLTTCLRGTYTGNQIYIGITGSGTGGGTGVSFVGLTVVNSSPEILIIGNQVRSNNASGVSYSTTAIQSCFKEQQNNYLTTPTATTTSPNWWGL